MEAAAAQARELPSAGNHPDVPAEDRETPAVVGQIPAGKRQVAAVGSDARAWVGADDPS